jgi:TonB-dependent receptor
MPSAQIRYRINPSSGIRLAYGRGISRPDFGDLPPYVVLSDRSQSISVGNPNLKPTRANNYDLLYEQYLNPLGVIQAGFFYKDIRSPIYYVQSDVTSGSYAGFQQTAPLNGSSAYVYGFEIAYQQHLSFLPGLLSGSGISANYSWTTSQANGVPGRSDSPALLRQAPNTWNVSPTYDRGRLSLRVGLSYNDANIFAYNYSDGAPLGLRGPNGDQYLYAHLQVDAQGSYRLPKGFTAFVYGLNLNNEVFGFYQGSGIYPIQREYYKPTVAAGLRWNLPGER